MAWVEGQGGDRGRQGVRGRGGGDVRRKEAWGTGGVVVFRAFRQRHVRDPVSLPQLRGEEEWQNVGNLRRERERERERERVGRARGGERGERGKRGSAAWGERV